MHATSREVRVRPINTFFLPKSPKMLPPSHKPADIDDRKRVVSGEVKDGEISKITEVTHTVSAEDEDRSKQSRLTHTRMVVDGQIHAQCTCPHQHQAQAECVAITQVLLYSVSPSLKPS